LIIVRVGLKQVMNIGKAKLRAAVPFAMAGLGIALVIPVLALSTPANASGLLTAGGAASVNLRRETATVYHHAAEITVHGIHYRVPLADRKGNLMVLLLQNGIVWTATPDIALDPMQSNAFAFVHPQFYRIYDTPYRETDGSLLTGARILASIPQRWLGAQEPRLASAWTGWLAQRDVEFARVQDLSSQDVSFNQAAGDPVRPVKVRTERGQVPYFPDFLSAQTGTRRPRQTPLFAMPQALRAMQGGFMLTVATRWDLAGGSQSGMTEANYYYSTRTGKWTPLNQMYVVQTVTGFVTADARAAFWQQLLPAEGANLTVGQMWFDPQTLTLIPVWLGNLIMGPDYLSGPVLEYQFDSSVQASHSYESFQPLGFPARLYQTQLTLPDGQVLSESGPAREWRGLSLQLQVQGVSTQVSGNRDLAQDLVGNHSDVQEVNALNLPQGPALLIVNERTAPAANPAGGTKYEYWLVFFRADPQNSFDRLAFCLVARSRVKMAAPSTFLNNLAQTWVLPSGH